VIPNHIFDREAHHSRQDKGLTQETGTDLAVAQQLATNDTCLRIAPQEQQIEQDRVLAITSQQEIIADEQMLQQQTNNNQQTALTPLNDEHQTIPLKYDDTQPLALQIAENPQFIATNNRLDHLMRNLFDKIQSLNSRADLSNDPQQEISLRTACEKVSSLHNSLETAIKTYRQHPNQTTFERFKRTCHTSIEESRPILEIHRGLKQLLANIALAILGCGIIYLIAGAIHKACTNRFLFFRTDSEKLLDNIQQTIQKIEPPQSGEGALEK
jgi:hypothetical protein